MSSTNDKLSQINEDFVKKGASRIKEKDIEKVINKADEIRGKFRSDGPLQRFIEDLKLLISIIKDYWAKEYREIPFMSLAAIVFALLYVLNPVDLIPDPIPVVGLLDDALVMSVCLFLVEEDLLKYKEWKEAQTI